MMICDKCGYNNKETLKSCSSCGTRLESVSEQDVQRILDKASGEPEPLEDIKISIIDRIIACIAFVSVPVLLVLLILSSADIFQLITIPLITALSGFTAINPQLANKAITVRSWPYKYQLSGKSGNAIRRLFSWGYLLAAIISTVVIISG